MADIYTNSTSRKKKRKERVYGKEFILLLLDLFVTLVMALLVFATVTSVVCQYISPERSGILSTLALVAPVVYLLDIVVMFYWVVRWRWYRASLMIAVVVLGLFYVSRYYKFDFDRQYDTSYIERRYTKVVTYNILDSANPEFMSYVNRHNPDILCLQEVVTSGENWSALTDKYKTTYRNDELEANTQILSKYRILRSGEIDGLIRKHGVWADLKIESDTVRVVNLHLQSTSILPEDTQFLERHEYIIDSEREDKLRSIVDRLVENNCKRAEQAEAVAKFLENSPYTTIVCGDFNDVPLSYTYHLIAKRMDDTFSRMADGFAYTYDTRYRLLRIDNILVSPSVEVVSYEVDDKVALSDHFPVISRLKFTATK